jgi:hypothetical protein
VLIVLSLYDSTALMIMFWLLPGNFRIMTLVGSFIFGNLRRAQIKNTAINFCLKGGNTQEILSKFWIFLNK